MSLSYKTETVKSPFCLHELKVWNLSFIPFTLKVIYTTKWDIRNSLAVATFFFLKHQRMKEWNAWNPLVNSLNHFTASLLLLWNLYRKRVRCFFPSLHWLISCWCFVPPEYTYICDNGWFVQGFKSFSNMCYVSICVN